MSRLNDAPLRRRIYTLLIVIAGGMGLGRILHAELLLEPSLHEPYGPRGWKEETPKPMPTFSSNDRSRWATIKALVENGTYVVGHRERKSGSYTDTGIIFEDGYGSVDKALHPETDEFYSTKPPLLPTIMAGEYWILYNIFGLSLDEDRWAVVRVMVLTFNWLPFLLFLFLLSRLVDSVGVTDWGRILVMATACFGTMMTPFLISINNHTIAASSVMVSLYAAARIWTAQREDGLSHASKLWFALAGFFAMFTACNELPALAYAVGILLLLIWFFPRQALLVSVPFALIPAAALLYTNYLAVGELEPVYAKFGTEWYEYEGSHWAKTGEDRIGIDFAADYETRGEYAFHLLLGHHGLFSLTPMLLLSVGGMLLAFRKQEIPDTVGPPPPLHLWRGLTLCTLLLTVVVVGFYLYQSTNYGGWSSGPRWLMWLTPFWLLAMVPVVDWLGEEKWGRILVYLLLLLSVLSAHYTSWNPWRHPWIYDWMQSRDMIPFDPVRKPPS